VREALFHVIGDISGLDVLDLFAGTGAVGIEALSRGAARLTLIEKGRRPCAVIRENIAAFGIGEKTELFQTDTLKALNKLHAAGRSFHFIFADPPYEMGLSRQAIELVFDLDILASGGVMAVTVRHNEDLPGDSPGRELVFDRRYGDTKLVMYRRRAAEKIQ
jgi:16S rRNA (guanine(966)-N(2))-methyltransferase RsmD